MEYGQGEIVQQAPILADITGFYAAFGLEMPPTVHERADHVSVECEFMSILATKEAWAVESVNQEAVEIFRDAQARFLEDHLGRWLPALARRIEEADPNGFYGELGGFAASFIAEECVRFGIPVGPPLLELRPIDPTADATISCGVEESCPDGRKEPLVQLGIDRG
jgi:TorA maturation chaperone TorD